MVGGVIGQLGRSNFFITHQAGKLPIGLCTPTSATLLVCDQGVKISVMAVSENEYSGRASHSFSLLSHKPAKWMMSVMVGQLGCLWPHIS